MTKASFDRYADIKTQIKALEEEAETLKPQILAEMHEAGSDKVEHEFGNFVITKKKTWQFSDRYDSMKDVLKQLESDEKADGTATFEEMEILMFKEKKMDV